MDMTGRVMLAEKLGDHTLLHLALGGENTIVFKADGEVTIPQGEPMTVGASFSNCHVFDADGQALT